MIICPNCSRDALNEANGRCNDCGWERLEHDGIQDYMTIADRKSELANDYVENYESLAKKNLEKSNIDRRFLRNQALNLAKYIGPVAGLDVADIGIGQGFLCDELLRRNVNSVTAVDVSRSYLARFVGHHKIRPYIANAESLPFRNHFDMLVSTDVMEHVINVGSFLFCVNRALKADGLAAIRVPYCEPLLAYSPHTGYGHQFGHLRSFDRKILKKYMIEAGFEVRSMNLDGYSAGTPQPYLYDTDYKKSIYNRIANRINRRLEHPADATLMNTYIARLLMRPVEIVVVAQKRRELA